MKNDSLLRITSPPSSATSIFTVMAYTVVALLVYAYATNQLAREEKPLKDRCKELTEERDLLKKGNLELSEMTASLSDPAADEYALITELGRIPKGSIKIIFENKKEEAE